MNKMALETTGGNGATKVGAYKVIGTHMFTESEGQYSVIQFLRNLVHNNLT